MQISRISLIYSVPFMTFGSRVLGAAGLATSLAVLLFAGCGRSDYESLMTSGKEAHVKERELRKLQSTPVLIPDSNVSIQLPKLFPAIGYAAGSVDPKTNEPLRNERLYPPMLLRFPGHKVTYEATYSDPKKKMTAIPYYCYLSVVPADGGKAPSPAADVLDTGKSKLAKIEAKWEPVKVKKPDGTMLDFQRLRIDSNQAFERDVLPEDLFQPGRFELYLYSSPDYYVLVGFRWPDAAEAPLQMTKLAELSVGTLSFEKTEDKPDKTIKPAGAK